MCYGQEINSALRVARKGHKCMWCGEPIEKKTKYFYWFGLVVGEPQTTKLHPECQDAINANEVADYDGCYYLEGNQPRGGFDEKIYP